MKICALIIATTLVAGCIDCDIFFQVDDPWSDGDVEIETGTDTGADTDTDTGHGQDCTYEKYYGSMVWRCNCDEQHNCRTCPGDVCIYTLTGDDADIVCTGDSRCQLLCNPLEESGCHFDECDGELLDCSRYGYSCDYWCPNT